MKLTADQITVDGDTACREWQRGTNGAGYGFKWNKNRKRKELVHRWVVETAGADQFGTPWNPALVVMHLCDNRACFRFDHLRLGTVDDNNKDMANKGRATGARGEKAGNVRLTAEAVLDIRHRATSERAVDLAREYGVSPEAIADVVKRRNWKHI